MKICLISPYHGGSHQAWAEGFQQHSQHDITLLALPARFWKWRMHGGAVTLARRYSERKIAADLLLATDMLDLTTFLALTRPHTAHTPIALYMHENQLTYPLPADPTTGPMRRQLGERDLHYAFINYASMLAAERIFFNSHYHLDSFFAALPSFLKHYPEYNELNTISKLRRKSEVLPVGLGLAWLDEIAEQPSSSPGTSGMVQQGDEPPLIIWNQRWEYDKNPAAFFDALYQVADEGIDFRLAVCGQQFGRQPAAFDIAKEQLSQQLVHFGYAKIGRYRQLLQEAAVTVSTAEHEFFGISILEAIAARTFPLLPNRLSYPELIPAPFHPDCLYQSQEELVERLRWALSHPAETGTKAAELSKSARQYDWQHMAPVYDSVLGKMGGDAAF